MKAPTAFTLAAALVLGLAAPASAQSWYQGPSRTWSSQGYYGGHGYASGYRGYDYNGQADRPGDYRCDAYWDAGRDDCGAAWRDQRPFVRPYSSGRYRSGYGYGYGHGYRPQGHGYGQAPAAAYYGSYGRPDLVYPSSGYGGGHAGGRDSGRAAWCASRYRSYDPGSGYYRAYSGRLVFCG
jgi:hypothetical protein